MKRIIIIAGSILSIIIVISLVFIYFWMGNSIKGNIEIAKKQYSGNAEDALISLLSDENNSPTDRTHTAIWTLGQLKSKKALPLLKELYKDDPKGETCYGKHNTILCQYEIYKAIRTIERGSLFSYKRFNI